MSAEADTCVEIYEVLGDNYNLTVSQYFTEPYSVYTLPSDLNQDLTGYFINSSRPIAVLSGHSCGFVPERVFFCDHMVEQIPPVSELGLTHIVPPIIGRLPDAG